MTPPLTPYLANLLSSTEALADAAMQFELLLTQTLSGEIPPNRAVIDAGISQIGSALRSLGSSIGADVGLDPADTVRLLMTPPPPVAVLRKPPVLTVITGGLDPVRQEVSS